MWVEPVAKQLDAVVAIGDLYRFDRRPLLLVGDHRLVNHQPVGEVNSPDD